ncbi:divalent-cation tolerance protein CutA [Methylovorus glucosotrophus]|uniref:CutA1 divalent ion tolerance protein n=1 Tax=Methylovorus glucosotrophus (strain SIP3-4) TaxID=582744 RepID=C6X7N5_METGS|nr:divalent-cation tolerance protein CutA [Methylovorus glucosotrophus]ACT49277.1 CutA1 divalent ion tolerance protein [Methylovorus glucosotrophus SIP3-4]
MSHDTLSNAVTASEAILVLTNMPDQTSANNLAASLVNARLAACVNILAPCTSVYRWQGKVETANEIPLLIKTCPTQYAALQQAIVQQHPYELPEILCVPISTGLPAYLAWLNEETTA